MEQIEFSQMLNLGGLSGGLVEFLMFEIRYSNERIGLESMTEWGMSFDVCEGY